MLSLTHDAVIEAMRTVQEPELGRDLITLDMVKDVVIDGSALSLTIELTTPACPLKDEIERTTNAALGAIGATNVDITWGAMVRRAQPRQAEQLVPGRQEHHRRRLGQGRRRQEHGQRQPRGRARPVGRDRRPPRRRHHRPEHPADDGPRGPAQGERQQQDHAARALRRQGHLDPVLRAGGPADRLARPARRRRDPAVPARRRLGRARLPRHRPAARHVRRPADARPGRADLRRRPGDDAAGGLAGRRRQGARDVPADERAGHRPGREHDRVRLPALRRGDRDLRPRRRRALRGRARPRVPRRHPARHHGPPGWRRRRAGRRPARAGTGGPAR